MPDEIDINDVNAANANFGTQIFNGTVYIINGRVDALPVAKQTRVFLSYARADDDPDYDDPAKSLLCRLTADLTAANFAVWWDRKSLPSRGIPFDNEIAAAIRTSDRFVLVAGPGAAASDWVQAELNFARELCKPITTILRAGDYDVIPVEIRGVNAIDFRPPRAYAPALRDLVTRLQEDAPLGDLRGVKPLPTYHLKRERAFSAARAAICTEALTPVVISAPTRAVALFGYGGVGKTTLAAALAHDCDVRRTFRDGVIWLEVGQTPAPLSLQAAIGATVFGDDRDHYQDEQNGRLALAHVLKNKAALIVLDDVWDHRVVAHFPIEETACRLLITTRSGALAGKIEGADIRLDLLTPEEGAALIAKRAGGNPNDVTYRQIAVTLGGHTLAIALAAAQLENHYAENSADLLRLLTKRDNPFAQLKLSDDDKNENLELSLSLSYTALTADLQRRFRMTGVMALEGTFDRAALAALWGDADEDDSRGPLRTLLDAGLLEEAGAGRYRQHRLLRAYARALLETAGEFDVVATLHLHYYADLHGAKREHTNTDYLQTIDIDLDNLRSALHWGLAHAIEPACDLLNALDNYFRVYQSQAVYAPLLRAALAATEAVSYVPGLANTLRALGDLSVRQDELEAARAFYDRALPLFEQIGARLGLANTLKALGDLSVRQDELEAARAFYDRALPLFEQIGARLGLANTLRALGDLSVRQAELEAARAFYDRALPLYEQIGDRLGLANTLQALGDLSVRQDELEAARAFYDRALPLFEQIGDRLGLANTLQALGDLSVRQDELEAARAFYDRALPLYEQIGDRLGLANTLKALGDLSVRQDELEAARAFYDRALPLFEQIGARLGLANTLRALGDLSVRQAELEAARAFYDRALPLFEQIGARLGLANTLRALGDLSVRQAELEAARAFYDRALPLYEQIGDRLGLANTLKALGDLSVRQDELEAARAFYDRALPLFEQIGDRLGLANTLQALGDLSVRQAELEAARAFYDRALPLFEQIGARLGLANTLMSLGDMLVGQKLWGDAVIYYQRALPIARQIRDRLSTANILYDFGLALFELGEQDEGIQALRECVAIFEAIDPRRWAVTAKRRLADLLRRAGQVNEADALAVTPPPEDQQQQVMQMLAQTYAQGGADAVRQLLEGQVPEGVIEQLLAQFEQTGTQAPSAVQTTLPKQTVEALGKNTVAVKTGVPEKLDDWRGQLTQLQTEWAGRGDDYAIETAFADALIAILDDQPAELPDDNPYQEVVRQVIEAIQSFKQGDHDAE